MAAAETETAADPLCVLIHGAGQSAAEFAASIECLRESLPATSVDLVGHGERAVVVTAGLELECDAIVADAVEATKRACREAGRSSVVLVGHSLGGAVAVRVAAELMPTDLDVVGVVVAELVAETAASSLSRLEEGDAHRPDSFTSMEEAAKWAVKSRLVADVTRAARALPGMLQESEDGLLRWRVPLAAHVACWRALLEGHTRRFLKLHVPRLLLLSATVNTEAALLTGQMQGKFAVKTLPMAGHLLHVDAPGPFAHAIVEFLKRTGGLSRAVSHGRPLRLLIASEMSPPPSSSSSATTAAAAASTTTKQ